MNAREFNLAVTNWLSGLSSCQYGYRYIHVLSDLVFRFIQHYNLAFRTFLIRLPLAQTRRCSPTIITFLSSERRSASWSSQRRFSGSFFFSEFFLPPLVYVHIFRDACAINSEEIHNESSRRSIVLTPGAPPLMYCFESRETALAKMVRHRQYGRNVLKTHSVTRVLP